MSQQVSFNDYNQLVDDYNSQLEEYNRYVSQYGDEGAKSFGGEGYKTFSSDLWGNEGQRQADIIGKKDTAKSSLQEKLNEIRGLNDAYKSREASEASDKQASRISSEAAQATASEAQKAARSTGVSQMRAGANTTGQASADYANQYVQNAPMMRGQAQSALNDYLAKIGASRQAETEASMQQQGMPWNILGSAITGAANSATVGYGLSDERAKEPADKDVLEAVDKYFQLVSKLREMKHGNE